MLRRRRNSQAQEAQQVDRNDEMDVDTEERDESNAVVAAADSASASEESVVEGYRTWRRENRRVRPGSTGTRREEELAGPVTVTISAECNLTTLRCRLHIITPL